MARHRCGSDGKDTWEVEVSYDREHVVIGFRDESGETALILTTDQALKLERNILDAILKIAQE